MKVLGCARGHLGILGSAVILGGWCVDVPSGLSYKTSGGEESAGTQVGPETTAKC